MNTVVDHLTAALDALEAELARITEVRNDTAALIEQLLPTAPAPERPLTSPATGQAARPGAGAPARPKRAQRPKATPAPETAPAPASARTEARKPTSPVAQVDYHEVADVIRRARAEGKSQRHALMEHFDAPMTTVQNWITKVYKLGLLDKKVDAD